LSIPVESESDQPLERSEQEDRSSNCSESGDEMEQLRMELQEARAEIEALKVTVTTLETQVQIVSNDCGTPNVSI